MWTLPHPKHALASHHGGRLGRTRPEPSMPPRTLTVPRDSAAGRWRGGTGGCSQFRHVPTAVLQVGVCAHERLPLISTSEHRPAPRGGRCSRSPLLCACVFSGCRHCRRYLSPPWGRSKGKMRKYELASWHFSLIKFISLCNCHSSVRRRFLRHFSSESRNPNSIFGTEATTFHFREKEGKRR